MGRGTTKSRKAPAERQRQPQYYYKHKGLRQSVKFRVATALHEKLQGSTESGQTQLERWDEALTWFLRFYKKNPDTPFEAALRRSDDNAEHIYWIAVDLLKAAKAIAEERNVAVARVVHTAGARFVAARGL